jgi:TRAP-type C4-dicarboxylate transport system permease small subunit
MTGRLIDDVCLALERIVAAAAVALLAVITLMNALEIVSRSFFDYSFQWIYETNLLLASWMYFLGIYLVYRRSGDIAMVGLRSVLPASARGVYDRTIHVVTGAVFIAVAWYAFTLIELQWPFRTPGVGFPRAAFTVPLLIGVGAIGVDALRRGFGPQGGIGAPPARREDGV